MTGSAFLQFTVASLVVAISPGPDILTVVTRSVTQGVRAGIVASLGFASGLTVHTTLAALGIAAMLKAHPNALLVIRCLGAAYLLYLAVRNILSKSAFILEAKSAPGGLLAVYRQSILGNVLNPKVTLFFLVFLSGVVEREGNGGGRLPTWLLLVILGAVFALCTIIVFGTCAIFAGGISQWLRRRTGNGAGLRWATSAVFVAVAVWILWP
ncbi:MAG: LysE family translocator [Phycisphaerales bacterium]|nr:LysE family translocator [Phycisphaerales bacterium]